MAKKRTSTPKPKKHVASSAAAKKSNDPFAILEQLLQPIGYIRLMIVLKQPRRRVRLLVEKRDDYDNGRPQDSVFTASVWREKTDLIDPQNKPIDGHCPPELIEHWPPQRTLAAAILLLVQNYPGKVEPASSEVRQGRAKLDQKRYTNPALKAWIEAYCPG